MRKAQDVRKQLLTIMDRYKLEVRLCLVGRVGGETGGGLGDEGRAL
jgi:hypothetical protein